MCIFIKCKERFKSSTSVLERIWAREQHVHYLKSVDDRMHVLIVLMTIAIISRIHPCSLVFMLGLKRVFCGEKTFVENIPELILLYRQRNSDFQFVPPTHLIAFLVAKRKGIEWMSLSSVIASPKTNRNCFCGYTKSARLFSDL